MGINISLIGQMLTFALLVVFTAKFVWPHIIRAMEEREAKIAEGLAAGERGERELELAKRKATESLREAKLEGAKLVEQAEKRASKIVEDAKEAARLEADKVKIAANEDIEQQKVKAREALRQEIGVLALSAAEKILGQKLEQSANSNIIEQLISEVSSE